MSNIIGIYGCCGWNPSDAWLHNSGVSLFCDGEHKSTISEERLTRIKYDGQYPRMSIKYVLDIANISCDDINIVTYVRSVHSLSKEQQITTILQREFPNAHIVFVDHHIAHASAAFFTSGFNRSSLLTFDGAGTSYQTLFDNLVQYETGFYGMGDTKSGITTIKHFLNGVNKNIEFDLGNIYNTISRIIYTMMEPEKSKNIDNQYIFMESAPGKIMGLAAYGDHAEVDLPNLFRKEENDHQFPTIYNNWQIDENEIRRFEPADLADWLQNQFIQAIIDYFIRLHDKKLLEKYLCISGGCALNVLMNKAIMDLDIFKDIHVFPASNDSGLPFGAAIYMSHVSGEKIKQLQNWGSLGKSYTHDEILQSIKNT